MKMSYLLSELQLQTDENHNPMLCLQSLEHVDYIEDVLCGHFNIDYEYKKDNKNDNHYSLYFGCKYKVLEIENALKAINTKHQETGVIYDTI